jgi:glutamine cyclotransferase
MHSGRHKKSFLSPWGIIFSFAILACITFGCKDEEKMTLSFSAPDQGQNFKVGDEIKIKLDAPKEVKISSVVYLIDSTVISTNNNADSIVLPTKGLPLGYRMISAIVTQGEKKDTISTNIVLKANKAPVQLSYRLVNSFPHDTTAYTEGLSYVDGKLLESTGEKGASELKWVDLKSGKTLQKTKLEPQYFGEGSLKIGDKIIMLTWQESIGFIFDAKTFKQIGTFPYGSSREGWGLTFDGKQILRTDGSNRIWKMNANTFKEEGYLEVYNEIGPLESLNELEYIEGKIYANVYLTSKIVRIDPNTGMVEAELDLSALVPQNFFKTDDEKQNNVLNGIAWDAKGKRLFVGGKKWPKLYEIKLDNTSAK